MTPDQIRSEYAIGKTKIILVPGHDPVHWGTQFGKGKSLYKEGDLTVALAYELEALLAKDPKLEIAVSRKRNGEYADWLSEYIEDHGMEVAAWRKEHIASMQKALASGTIQNATGVYHNKADTDTATYLSAINKYANDTGVPIVLHIHFDDFCCRRVDEVGKYDGFTIYVPEHQFPNAPVSRAVAESVEKTLGRVLPGSSLPAEQGTIVEDQGLVAIGPNATRDGASLLVEYGYIYESALRSKTLRPLVLKEYAAETAAGLLGFLDPERAITPPAAALFPRRFDAPLLKGMKNSPGVLRLQYALLREGFYPPYPLTLHDCPLSGSFGDCTEDALANFQEKNFGYATGVLGSQTLGLLNKLYGK